jgi:hypothetical protein
MADAAGSEAGDLRWPTRCRSKTELARTRRRLAEAPCCSSDELTALRDAVRRVQLKDKFISQWHVHKCCVDTSVRLLYGARTSVIES